MAKWNSELENLFIKVADCLKVEIQEVVSPRMSPEEHAEWNEAYWKTSGLEDAFVKVCTAIGHDSVEGGRNFQAFLQKMIDLSEVNGSPVADVLKKELAFYKELAACAPPKPKEEITDHAVMHDREKQLVAIARQRGLRAPKF